MAGVITVRRSAKVGANEPTKQQCGRAKNALLSVANGGTAQEGIDGRVNIDHATFAETDERFRARPLEAGHALTTRVERLDFGLTQGSG